jgi:uncharacterized protein YjiS (DUF1127 family)
MQMLHSSIVKAPIVHLQHGAIFICNERRGGISRPQSKERKMSAMDLFTRSSRVNPARFTGFVSGLTQRLQQYKTYRQTFDELERLTDRELADLDISRLQLRSIAYRAAYGG